MKKVYPILILFISLLAHGQVKFTQIPMDSGLIARDLKTNSGTAIFTGTVNNAKTPYDSLCLKVYRDGIEIDSVYQNLLYTANIASFNFSYPIPAELHEYTIKVYGIINKVQTSDTTIYAILAGDVYIIEGQSNALALMRDNGSANSNKSEYIRSFANSDSNTAGFLTYLKWGIADGDGNGKVTGHNFVGQWGIRLARLLVDSMKIPIAIFNGACGGTPISYYERPANYKTNLNSNYAREYYRLTLTGLQNNVRAILWSQGETDAQKGTSINKYINEFDTLQKDWKQDYPGFKKTYIFQTRNGGMPSYPFTNLQIVKEAEREAAVANDSDVEIISTSALRQDSGNLHFDYKGGYEIFGDRAYNLVARDIYGISSTKEIDSPMLTAAYLTDSTTLVVVENADSLIRHNQGQAVNINDFEIENANGANIDTITLNKNKIIFKLSKYPGSGITVSFLAQPQDSGNWVTNTNGIEILCFYEYTVTDSIPGILTGITEYAASANIKAYPNPFHGFTNIAINTYGTYLVELDDMAGRKLSTNEFNGTRYRLNTDGLASGIYFARIFDHTGNAIGIIKLSLQ